MKRMAIFVEGQTEQLFVTKLLTEIAGEKNISIEQEKAITKNGNRLFSVIHASKNLNKRYYVLIRDSGNDELVQSDIRDSCENLAKKNYEKILCLRDVYPKTFADIPKLELGLRYGIPTRFIPIHIILAIMEVEAWFLAETTHFSRIHPSLTNDLIKRNLNFDPETDDVESRPHPSQDLDYIYGLAGFAYNKRKTKVQRTIQVLDYSAIYLTLIGKVKNLKKLIDQIDSFLD
jgi:hypothetical protein